MATYSKCDRCGKSSEKQEVEWFILDINASANYLHSLKRYLICASCKSFIISSFDAEPTKATPPEHESKIKSWVGTETDSLNVTLPIVKEM